MQHPDEERPLDYIDRIYVCERDLSEDSTKEIDTCGGWMRYDVTKGKYVCGSCNLELDRDRPEEWGLKLAKAKLRDGDQPLPKVNDNAIIHELVVDDVLQRLRIGTERYGTGLQAFNGRSALRDAYEEVLDLAAYLRQEIYERDHQQDTMLTIEAYQDQVVPEVTGGLSALTLQLPAKVGRVSDALTNLVLDKVDGIDWRTTFVYWTGDLLQHLATICQELGVDLDTVAQTNIAKLAAEAAGDRPLDKADLPEGATVLGENEYGESTFEFGGGQKLVGVHDPDQCEGRGCVVHHPSNHHMVSWRLNWRNGGMFDIKPPHFERVCEHGIGHPDPDDVAYWKSRGEDVSVHGCDGCCTTMKAGLRSTDDPRVVPPLPPRSAHHPRCDGHHNRDGSCDIPDIYGGR